MTETKTSLPSGRGVGEVVEKDFIRVVYQRGFPNEVGINGCRVEDVIALAMERLLDYERGLLACEENQQAIQALKFAVRMLEERRQRREEQGVLNTMSRHETIRTEDWHDDFSATGA